MVTLQWAFNKNRAKELVSVNIADSYNEIDIYFNDHKLGQVKNKYILFSFGK